MRLERIAGVSLRPLVAVLSLLAAYGVFRIAAYGDWALSAADYVTRPVVEHVVAPAEGGPNIDAARVEGHGLCLDCHRSEIAHWNRHWQESGHGWVAYRSLTGPKAAEYGEALGIASEELKTNSLCVKCHATAKLEHGGRMAPVMGISCEACHNPSGGEAGWLNPHAVYGPSGAGVLDESDAHHRQRMDRCQAAGQLRTADLYQLAQRCYACHLVGDTAKTKELVAAGHRAIATGAGFQNLLAGFTNEKVRHNFHFNPNVNAPVSTLWQNSRWSPGRTADNRQRMILVVGELARVESLLRMVAAHLETDQNFALTRAAEITVDERVGDALGGVQSEPIVALIDKAKQIVGNDDEDNGQWLVDFCTKLAEDAGFGEISLDRAGLVSLADVLRELAIAIAAGNGEELSGLDAAGL